MTIQERPKNYDLRNIWIFYLKNFFALTTKGERAVCKRLETKKVGLYRPTFFDYYFAGLVFSCSSRFGFITRAKFLSLDCLWRSSVIWTSRLDSSLNNSSSTVLNLPKTSIDTSFLLLGSQTDSRKYGLQSQVRINIIRIYLWNIYYLFSPKA